MPPKPVPAGAGAVRSPDIQAAVVAKFLFFTMEDCHMRGYHIAVAIALTLALLVSALPVAADATKSSLQVGEKIPGPFHPLNVTGEKAGQKNCLVCQNGTNPVAMIFARDVSDPLTKLIAKVDAATAKNSGCQMGSFVVFLSDSPALEQKLKETAQKNGIKHTVLSIDNPAGPQGYKVAKDADVTVVLYTKHTVKANYAFKKGEMKDADVDKIVADVTKIVPEK
jgi:hypothetical protein